VLPVAWAHAARCFAVGRREALAGWLFSWLENQLLVLMKALPLGHGAAQRLMSDLVPLLPRAVDVADELPLEDLSGFAPRLSFALMQHQFQYSRLFRT
jgi:urease accessory protein